MKLLTLNTHSWLEIHQLHKIKILADFIVEQEIDVVALQEVNQNSISSATVPGPNFIPAVDMPVRSSNFGLLLVQMLQDAGAPFTWSWADSHRGWGIYDEGISLLSRLPVTQMKVIETSRPNYTFNDVFRRCALAAEIDTGCGPAWFVSAHMNWWFMEGEYLFEHDFASLDAQVRDLAGDSPVFLLGDFNNDAAIEREGYCQVLSLGWHDSFHNAQSTTGEFTVHKNIAGWENATQKMRLDYVFTSIPLTFAEHRVVFADHSPQAISDHSGILVDFNPAHLNPAQH